MTIIRHGVTRIVVLTKRYAFKFPNFINSAGKWRWRTFLEGLLANMREADSSRVTQSELCPVLFSISGGFLVVMPRVEVLSDTEFETIRDTLRTGFYALSELKPNSFGWLNGKPVAIDYGN